MSRSSIRWIIVVVLAIAAFALWRSGLLAELNLQGLKARQASLGTWVAAHHWLALGSFFVAYVAVTSLSLPGAAILTLAAGALFGLLEGTVLVSFASSIGATLAFLVSRFVLRDSLRAKYGKRLRSFDEGIERDGGFYLFTMRLVPAFPFFLVNLLAGLTALKTSVFYLVSQIGMLPGTIAFVYAGTQLAQIDSLSGILSPGLIGAFVLLGILPLLMRWLTRWIQARRVYKGYQRPSRFDFNLIVIGAGSAGLVSSYIAATVKAKVALIERHRMGGDCLNTGCVPSKALLRSARLMADARNSERYGIAKVNTEIDFADVMSRVHEIIAKIEPHDSVERYTELGVDVIKGDARILSPWQVDVDGQRYTARSLIIATGAQARVPDMEGLDTVDFRTSDTLWEIRELPKKLVIIGGGPIGCELAQAFARLGSKVTLVQKGSRLLPREDVDASTVIETRFAAEGIDVITDCEAIRVEGDKSAGTLIGKRDGTEVKFDFDRLLLALGRKPNVEGFGLEELGVEIDKRGTVKTDALLRTNFPNILVAGDVAGPYQFTHVASHQAWYASVNALIAPFWSFKADYRVIPWATFTDPEVARVGLSEAEAKEQEIEVEVSKYGLDDLDRAIADSADHGYVKILTPPGKDTILGATIVGEHAGDLLAEFVLAMKHGIGLNKLLGTIHIYPTMSEANKMAAGVWKRANAPQGILRMAAKFFAWRRG
ncbi:MAG TPA: FAD-dependent oxidoreductase [Dokdonella sp.]|uniref:FAD-dependent oxidoreductase n=1 Tax=Dokdonella sp. TaxID=2291710 RepID=UPI002D80F191|nr:FAD-dependent oxidoreductase [Dokdonella sp.]HET9031743.1 FAD-dependent oxidoreductase [Dokdonella sp.]